MVVTPSPVGKDGRSDDKGGFATKRLTITRLSGGLTMLRLAIVFFVVALIAALFGFGFVSGMAWDAAKILFFVFIVLAVLAFLGGALRSPPV
jgi:uncharacterized membrane protein YtjA (UPF0391 family)